MRIETRYEYIAFDGTIFTSMEACQRHELIVELAYILLSELPVPDSEATAIATTAAELAIDWIKNKADANQFFNQD